MGLGWPAASERGRRIAAGVLIASLGVAGCGWSVLRLWNQPRDSVEAAIGGAGGEVLLRVTVLDTPRFVRREDGVSGLWTARVRSRGVVSASGETLPARGELWLRAPGEERDGPIWRSGARLVALGSFRAVEEPRNPGEFDLRRWARDRGIEGSLRARSALMVRPDESPTVLMERVERVWRGVVGAVRARASMVVASATGSSGEGTKQLMRGLLLGEDPEAPLDEVRSFYRVGLAHVLSISGFHLAVFAGAVLFVVRLLGDLGRLEPLIVAACVGLFLVIVPPSSPTVRAAVIVLVMLGASLFGRRYDRLTLLLWTAFAVLIVRPSELWSLGFQLSFGLTAALLGLSGRLRQRLFPDRLGRAALDRSAARHAGRWWQTSVAASLVCWLVSVPWLIVQLGVVNPLALVTGLLVTPLVSVLLWIGYAAVLLGMAIPTLAGALGSGAAKIADVAGALVVGADAMPGASVRLAWVSPAWGVVATVWLVVWLVKPRLRRGTMVLAGVLITGWLGAELATSERLPSGVAMEVVRLDVGASTEHASREGGVLRRCVLVRTPGRAVLVGAGGLRARALATITRELGAATIDAVVFERADEKLVAEITRWVRPPRVVLVGEGWGTDLGLEPGSFERAATMGEALERLGIGAALDHLDRQPGRGVQVVEVPKDGRGGGAGG